MEKEAEASIIQIQLRQIMNFSVKLSESQLEIRKLKEEIFRLEQLLATAQQDIALHEYCDELDWAEANNRELEENE